MLDQQVLAVSKPADGLTLRGIVGISFREANASRGEEALDPFVARLPVDVLQIIRGKVEGEEGLRRFAASVFQEGVERFLPCPSMNFRGLGHDPVQVEDDGVESRVIGIDRIGHHLVRGC